MRASTSTPNIKLDSNIFDVFMGLDVSRDIIALETGKEQYLTRVQNAYCDRLGQIVREPSAQHVASNERVTHVSHFNSEVFSFAENLNSGIRLKTSSDHEKEDAFWPSSVISSTVFGGFQHFASRGQPMWRYDGNVFRNNSSVSINTDPPGFLTTCSRRMVAAGFNRFPTQVWLSRVDDPHTWEGDEDPNDENVLRAGKVDIRNMIKTGDVITGIAEFEWNRLCIFTSSQVLIYKIDPNVNQWDIDDRVAATVGCVSHNSIAPAGKDLIFCAPSGVYSLRRSKFNSVAIYSYPMSDRVNVVYRELYHRVPDKQRISGCWDQASGRYHCFFPINDALCYRLSVLLMPDEESEPKWSTGDYLQANCASVFGGRLLWGTPGGVYQSYDLGEEVLNPTDAVPVELDVMLPVVWAGSTNEIKTLYNYMLMMSGTGPIQVEFFDERDNKLHTDNFHLDEIQNSGFPWLPLAHQLERKLEKRFVGLQMRITSSGIGLTRISGIAINTRK